jgi:hypothetical protein
MIHADQRQTPLPPKNIVRRSVRPQRIPIWSSREAFFTDLGLFTLGVAGAYSVPIVGSLPGCEFILLPLLPVLLLYKGSRAFKREYFWFYTLVGAWLLGTLIADVYASSPMEVRLKGTARVIFFLLDFMALAILISNKTRRMIIFALGVAALMALSSRNWLPNLDVVWKFGMGEAVAIVALLVSSYFYGRGRFGICFLISFVLAGVNLAYGYRSQLAVHFVSAVLILPLTRDSWTRRSGSRGEQNILRMAIVLLLAGGAAYAANAAIKYAARSGFFDESTQLKFETQAQGDYGVLFGGRPETLVALQAILDSPFIGHGSFPYGPEYIQMRQDLMYEHGYSDSDEPKEDEIPVIPTHSHLTMAWVEGGILGGICWIYILALTLRAAFRLSVEHPPFAPLYCYLLVAFLWDILYSPFGSVNRILAAFYILLSYNLLKSSVEPLLNRRRQQVDFRRASRRLTPARRAAY